AAGPWCPHTVTRIMQHPPHLMPPSPPQVLFFGEFRPKETGELDEVKFREAVVTRIIHVVPAGEQPTQVALPPTFRGITQVEPFQLEVFCKNLNNMHSRYFDRLMPTATVPGGAVYTMPQDIVTNHLVIRGSFQAMSVVICGTVVPRTALSPDAIQALTASDKPSLGGPSPPPSALVPPPPPRPSPPPQQQMQQQQQQAMAVDGPPPPPPPARPATQALPAAAAVVGGPAAAPPAAAPRKRTAPKAASSSSDKPSSPPPPAATASGAGSSKDSSSLPKAWAPLALPAAAAATAAAAVGQGGTTGDGVSPADLAPYGEAELSTALTVPPERLQRSAAEANPFDDRFLVPTDAARGVKEAVARLVSLADESGPAGRNLECEALEAAADCVEACFRRQTPAKKGEEGRQEGGLDPAVEQGSTLATIGTTAAAEVPSSEAFNDDVAGPLATAVIRSLRFFRAAAAGTEAGSIPAGEGEEERGGGRHTPAVAVLADGSITVDDGHRRVALAGLRLAGAVATAPSPARALLAAGGFHVLWRLPLDPAATPMGVALALGALCQGIRHADVLRVFLTRWEGGVDDGTGGAEAEGLSRLGGYEACASVLSRQVAHPAALSRGRSIMQYVALVECLQLVRKLAAKAGTTVAAAKAAEATGKDGGAGEAGGAAAAAAAAAAGPAAVKGMEDLAHALGALEALVSEGAGETSASGIQPGIRKGDRKRRLQGFEVLLAKADAKAGDGSGTAAPDNNDDNKSDDPNVAAAISAHLGREAARDKRPRGGLAPSLVALLWEHQLPAALAAGVAAAALASEKEAASSSAAMMSRFREGTAAGGEGGGGEEGPASAAAALVFAGVREVALRLLRGAGDPLSGALVFAGQPRSTAALAYGLDPSALATPVGPEGSPTIEALADGLDQ
ncbi:unnamed protein product, partial [Ectocarpus fasciculatus]